MKIDPKNLNKLLDEVAADVAGILAKSEKPLAKADPGEEAPGESTPAGSSAEGSAPPEAPGSDPSEGPEGSPGDAAPEAPQGEGQEGDPAADESAGPEALVAEYAKLPIEELKMHVMAAHQALMQSMPDQGQPDAGAPAPDAGQGAPGMAPEGTPPAGTEQPPMGKKEIKASPGNGGKIMKSETDTRLAALEKALAEKDTTIEALKRSMDEAVTGLTNFVAKSGTVAMRKSIAGISVVGKPGTEQETTQLSKSEAIAKCNALDVKSLKKSDREAVMSFVIGSAPQSTISHLLK